MAQRSSRRHASRRSAPSRRVPPPAELFCASWHAPPAGNRPARRHSQVLPKSCVLVLSSKVVRELSKSSLEPQMNRITQIKASFAYPCSSVFIRGIPFLPFEICGVEFSLLRRNRSLWSRLRKCRSTHSFPSEPWCTSNARSCCFLLHQILQHAHMASSRRNVSRSTACMRTVIVVELQRWDSAPRTGVPLRAFQAFQRLQPQPGWYRAAARSSALAHFAEPGGP